MIHPLRQISRRALGATRSSATRTRLPTLSFPQNTRPFGFGNTLIKQQRPKEQEAETPKSYAKWFLSEWATYAAKHNGISSGYIDVSDRTSSLKDVIFPVIHMNVMILGSLALLFALMDAIDVVSHDCDFIRLQV